uniref:Transposase IS116/IS110/IS902 family protein n=1 Tax=Candidatus Kentrum sp. TC TaxID=2126339 RepID=A0A450Z403_9GAMM|nr:MAG: hypothetical protein BECKTC1821E_GA0114239_11171 [Candidatus Kentron sp. TC]
MMASKAIRLSGNEFFFILKTLYYPPLENRLSAQNQFSNRCRWYEEMLHKDEPIASLEEELESIKQESEACKLPLTISGIRLLTPTALLAVIGASRIQKWSGTSSLVGFSAAATFNGRENNTGENQKALR